MSDSDFRLKKVIANCFMIPTESIDEETSVDSVKEWDSLKHLSLVLALESEFDVSLTADETIEILSFPLIKAILTDHGIIFDKNSYF
jgi:acyl carrier protein